MPTINSISISEKVVEIQERIAAAASRSGRSPDEITLVAVAKKKPAHMILEARAAGITDIGENYVQEALEKQSAIRIDLRWHLLGHLQSNKVKSVVAKFDLIQSIDSLKSATLIGRHAGNLGTTQKVLLEVHLGNETTKSGFMPDETLERAAQIDAISGIDLCGLMAIAPFGLEPRPYFQALNRLYEKLPAANRRILSMGMTGDFETAIEEGSTMIRIGTAIFGERS